jgi:hypothetical protein
VLEKIDRDCERGQPAAAGEEYVLIGACEQVPRALEMLAKE